MAVAALAALLAAAAPAQQPADDQLALPTTRPAQSSHSPSAGELRQWLRQLSDDDPEVRESAQSHLLALGRRDLPAFRDAVIRQRPLLPDQAADLHDLVIHVWLSSEPYPAASTSGFLGLHWPESQIPGDVIFPEGTVVAERLPGFCAYRMLRGGDVIVKLLDQPQVNCRSLSQFMDAIARTTAGSTLRLQVLRWGRLIEVPVVLDTRPQIDDLQAWIHDRQEKAQQYWDRQFAPLVQVSQSPAPAAGPDRRSLAHEP